MPHNNPVSVLLAPLDWGLGHATRCIPIIRELICRGARVVIASSGTQKVLLEQEFPGLEFLEIPGYEIRYNSGFFLKWTLVFRIPAILKQIKRENNWLAEILESREIQGVISDNRYGFYNKNLPSVFITHQLNIQSGWGSFQNAGRWQLTVGRWVDRKILKWNYRFIKKFSACWIPDGEGGASLAGRLSHPSMPPPVPIKYIGLLSRCIPMETRHVKNSLLILLSGPEPQRSRFEKIIFRQLAASPLEAVVVRGLPGSDAPVPFVREGVILFNHLPAEHLNSLLNESETIITRGGYSTIMDLVQLKRNAILVPTPGQTEQEYLGHYLHEKNWMYCVEQKNFKLEKVLAAFQKEKMQMPDMHGSSLSAVVEEFLKSISRED
jgi:UDP:flavonoid glycosyltransferase YjiC (YdhE family)